MNKGLARASGAFVGFLNSDDVYQDEHVIAEVARTFERGVDFVYGDIPAYGKKGWTLQNVKDRLVSFDEALQCF
jgi:hypothetical protein